MNVIPVNNQITANNKYKYVSYKANPVIEQVVFSAGDTIKLESANEYAQKIYKKFYKLFHEKGQNLIKESYMSCLNSDGSLCKDAIRVLYSYCGEKSPFWEDKIKEIFNRSNEKYYYPKLRIAADWVEACKDKNGNHVKENLDFLKFFVNCTDLPKDALLTNLINLIKDDNGIISEKYRKLFAFLDDKYIIKYFKNFLYVVPDKNNKISESVINFIYNFANLDYGIELLDATKNSDNRDEILDYLSNSEYCKKYNPYIEWVYDENNNINIEDLKYYINLKETEPELFKENLSFPLFLYKSDDKTVTIENIKQLNRLNNLGFLSDENKRLIELLKSSKTGDAINKDFIDFIINNKSLLSNDNASSFIDVAKQKDGSINFSVLSFIYKNVLANYSVTEMDNSLPKMVSGLCKDEEGNYTQENMLNAMKIVSYTEYDYLTEVQKYISQKFFEHVTKDKNLYKASDVLKILDIYGDIDFNLLTTEIPGYDNLLFVIADIPFEREPEAYEKIVAKLKDMETTYFNFQTRENILINYNITNSMNTSLLEKILNSNNYRLLNFIADSKGVPLEYSPYLDIAYKRITDENFKNLVDSKLHLEFPLLKDAVMRASIKYFEKVEKQLDSPFCNRKEILNKLWQLALKNKNKQFCLYFANRFYNELPNSIIDDLNKL